MTPPCRLVHSSSCGCPGCLTRWYKSTALQAGPSRPSLGWVESNPELDSSYPCSVICSRHWFGLCMAPFQFSRHRVRHFYSNITRIEEPTIQTINEDLDNILHLTTWPRHPSTPRNRHLDSLSSSCPGFHLTVSLSLCIIHISRINIIFNYSYLF